MTRPIFVLLLLAAVACSRESGAPSASTSALGTADEARKFLTTVNDTMKRRGVEQGQVGWTYSTYITPDTEALNARATQAYIEAVARFAKDATRFDNVELSADERRQMNLLKLA